jgi:two-component system response regulator AtoC
LAQSLKELSGDNDPRKTQTLFLDGIEELSPECQKLLLAAIPNGELLSGTGRVRARVISAASCDLDHEVAEGRFRRELYFRVNGARLRLPALRERAEDIPALVEHFLTRHAGELSKNPPPLSQEALHLLTTYAWPGNIRELENVARKMVALGNVALAMEDLRMPSAVPSSTPAAGKVSSLKVAAKAASRQAERELILQALERTKWNRKRAAKELQISYKSLLYKLKQIEATGTKNEE